MHVCIKNTKWVFQLGHWCWRREVMHRSNVLVNIYHRDIKYYRRHLSFLASVWTWGIEYVWRALVNFWVLWWSKYSRGADSGWLARTIFVLYSRCSSSLIYMLPSGVHFSFFLSTEQVEHTLLHTSRVTCKGLER